MAQGPDEDEEISPQSEYLREQSPTLPHYDHDIALIKAAVNNLDADPDGSQANI